MKITAIIFLIGSIALGAFGYWGMCTRAGNRAFDEMAGMIPFFAAIASVILFIIFLILFARITYLKKKKNRL